MNKTFIHYCFFNQEILYWGCGAIGDGQDVDLWGQVLIFFFFGKRLGMNISSWHFFLIELIIALMADHFNTVVLLGKQAKGGLKDAILQQSTSCRLESSWVLWFDRMCPSSSCCLQIGDAVGQEGCPLCLGFWLWHSQEWYWAQNHEGWSHPASLHRDFYLCIYGATWLSHWRGSSFSTWKLFPSLCHTVSIHASNTSGVLLWSSVNKVALFFLQCFAEFNFIPGFM